jgi:hypothetical protein
MVDTVSLARVSVRMPHLCELNYIHTKADLELFNRTNIKPVCRAYCSKGSTAFKFAISCLKSCVQRHAVFKHFPVFS